MEARVIGAKVASCLSRELVERSIALDARALRAGEERSEQYGLSHPRAEVEEAIFGTEARRIERVHDLVVAAWRVRQELGWKRRLFERRVRDPENLLDEVIAIEERGIIEVPPELGAAKLSARDRASDRRMARERGLVQAGVQRLELGAHHRIARA